MSETPNLTDKIYCWFVKAVPEPTVKNFTTQMGAHFEEVGEMLSSLVPNDNVTEALLQRAKDAVEIFSKHLYENSGCVEILEQLEEEYLDALCDQIVTAIGCARMRGHDLSGALSAVSESNYSKFDVNGDPIFNENKKVMKGPNYHKANLKPYLFSLVKNRLN